MSWVQVVSIITVIIILVPGFAILNDYFVYRDLQKRLKKEKKKTSQRSRRMGINRTELIDITVAAVMVGCGFVILYEITQ